MAHEDLFCIVLYILATSSEYLLLLGPYHFCHLSSPSFMKCSLGISDFLEEISSPSHSIVFLYFFALFIEVGFLSPCCSWELFSWVCISLSPLLFTSLLSSTICKASSDNHFGFFHFFFFGMLLVTASYTVL